MKKHFNSTGRLSVVTLQHILTLYDFNTIWSKKVLTIFWWFAYGSCSFLFLDESGEVMHVL